MSGRQPTIAVFACRFAAPPGPGEDAALRVTAGAARITRIACGATVHPGLLLRALEEGADGALVVTCPRDLCRFQEGAAWAADVVERTRDILRILGLPRERVGRVEGAADLDLAAEIERYAAALGLAGGEEEGPVPGIGRSSLERANR